MSDTYSPFVKFTYTLLDLEGRPQKKSWMLISDSHDLEIEKGLFMGRNRLVNNDCVVIYGNTNQQDTCIKWELKRSV